MHACMHAYIHTYVRTHIHTCMHYIHTYIHTCMHACMHTYIHTYIEHSTKAQHVRMSRIRPIAWPWDQPHAGASATSPSSMLHMATSPLSHVGTGCSACLCRPPTPSVSIGGTTKHGYVSQRGHWSLTRILPTGNLDDHKIWFGDTSKIEEHTPAEIGWGPHRNVPSPLSFNKHASELAHYFFFPLPTMLASSLLSFS